VLARRFNPQKNTTEKPLEMTATDDDVIASWRDRVGALRKRGRVSGSVGLCATLASRLRLTPSSKLEKRTLSALSTLELNADNARKELLGRRTNRTCRATQVRDGNSCRSIIIEDSIEPIIHKRQGNEHAVHIEI
jgi:hypothetical protein